MDSHPGTLPQDLCWESPFCIGLNQLRKALLEEEKRGDNYASEII